MKAKTIYLNAKQLAFAQAMQKKKVFVGGRGAGKSTVNGVQSFQFATFLPRSKGFILGLTYVQILTKFLPPVFDMWRNMSLVEHTDQRKGHYVVGKRPPSNWQTPYQSPKYFNNVISFWNGVCIELISFDRANLNRGGNYDWGIIDEAALIPKERWDKEIRPSIRGNIYRFSHPCHQSMVFTTSMPWLQSGMWIVDMEEEMRQSPQEVFYVEATAEDNKDVLGERYLRDLRRDLPQLIYQVEVMNMRLARLPNGFYEQFDDRRHTYSNRFIYTDMEAGVTYIEEDYSPIVPIELSFDFGAKFTCCIVGQEVAREMRIIHNFYDKRDMTVGNAEDTAAQDDIITSVVKMFAAKYAGRHKSWINLWGDRNGNSRQANSTLTFFEQIERELSKYGFQVSLMVERRLDPLHEQKHLVINKLLSESDPHMPRIRINQTTCKELIVSIKQSPITAEFKKDKSSERQDVPQERATHLSDAFDCLIYPKYHHQIEGGGIASDPIFL